VFVSRDVIFHENVFPFASTLTNFNFDGCLVIPNPMSSPSSNISSPNDIPVDMSLPSLSPIRQSGHDISLSSPHPPIRHSTLIRCRPGYLQHYHCNLATQSTIPISSTRLFSGKQHDISSVLDYHDLSTNYKNFCLSVKFPHWRAAMATEISALEANNTWLVIDLPPNKHPIGYKWVYQVKLKANGEVERYKARLVAKGYTQCEGLDYYDTFSPVAKLTTVWCLLALAAAKQ
jgi:hypothetical protein